MGGLLDLRALGAIVGNTKLPMAGSNIVDDISNVGTGFGYYNNTFSSSNQNAPARTLGTFLRFVTNYSQTTLFFDKNGGGVFVKKTDDSECVRIGG